MMNASRLNLLSALESTGESSKFCTSGIIDLVIPGMKINDMGEIALPISIDQAKQLINKAVLAPYGKGTETVFDQEVRQVWQIDPYEFKLENPAWKSSISKIAQIVKNDFGLTQVVSAELYKLLIYEKGSFFSPHRDTEKQKGMFGTLVVNLPSAHKGGVLKVSHDGKTEEICSEDAQYSLHFSAFYADCLHEVTPVTEGYRVCLVYNLIAKGGNIHPFIASEQSQYIAKLLMQTFLDSQQLKIVIPLKYSYTVAELSPTQLKGSDISRLTILSGACEVLSYDCNLALFTRHESGALNYDYFDGDWEDADHSELEIADIIDDSSSIDHWVDNEDRKKHFGSMEVDQAEILFDGNWDIFDKEHELEGPTGNEGATLDRWYRKAVIVIWPKKNRGEIIGAQGPSVALPIIREIISDQSRQVEVRSITNNLVHNWWNSNRDHKKLENEMLSVFRRLSDYENATTFISSQLTKTAKGTEGEELAKLCDSLGWDKFYNSLKFFFDLKSYNEETNRQHSVTLNIILQIFSGLCSAKVKNEAEK